MRLTEAALPPFSPFPTINIGQQVAVDDRRLAAGEREPAAAVKAIRFGDEGR
jgi:hypothetical protein